MKLSVLSIGLLACLTPLTAAWTKEDREIFRVRDELAAAEGPGVTFYDFLGVPPSASMDDINKAYRKKSRALHPDKVKSNLAAERAKAKKAAAAAAGGGKKKKAGATVAKAPTQAEVRAAIKRASEQQARLSIVANVLRGPGRDTYDHFLRSGFPVWKGTGYYYNRYRPGLGTVMFGLFLFVGGGAHYLALYMGWKRQREFVERYIRFARHAAWGDNLGANIPGIGEAAAAPAPPPAPQQQAYADEDGRPVALNRKQRRMQEREDKREAKSGNGGRKGRRGAPGSGAGSGTATPTQQALQGAGPTGAKKRVVAENGKILVVDSLGDVYLEQEDEDGNVGEFLLDNANMINHHAQPNELARPTIRDTALVRLPVWAYGATVGRVLGPKRADEDDEELEEEVDDDSSEPGKAVATPSTDSAAEDFEMLDRSTDSLGQAKTTGSQAQGGRSKGNKRKGKKK